MSTSFSGRLEGVLPLGQGVVHEGRGCPEDAVEEEAKIIALCEAGKLRSVVEPNIGELFDIRTFKLRKEHPCRFPGKTDGVDSHEGSFPSQRKTQLLHLRFFLVFHLFFQPSISPNVEYGNSFLKENGTYEEFPVTLSGVLFAAEDGQSVLAGKGFESVDALTESQGLAEGSVIGTSTGKVVGSVFGSPTEESSKVEVGNARFGEVLFEEFPVEVGNVTGIGIGPYIHHKVNVVFLEELQEL